MYSLNKATTTLEKIAGAFLRPKGITVYWNEPHSVAKWSYVDLLGGF